MSDSDRIIMLPGLKKSLEQKMHAYIEDKNYSEALSIANELIEHDVQDININLIKLSCLTELNKLDDAVSFIEDLLQKQDKHYYSYFEIYLGLLYETEQYEEIMHTLDETEIPEASKPVFDDFYRIAFQTNEKIKLASAKELITELEVVINRKDNLKQWNLINQLRKLKVKPPNDIIRLLKLDIIHPVVKTAVFSWLHETQYQDEVEIVKFDQTLSISPAKTENLTSHPVVKKTIFYLTRIEDENPSLYTMIEEMLIKYFYVNYPILPNESEAKEIAEALEILCRQSLYCEINEEINNELKHYMKDIEKSYKVYFEVIES